MLYTIRVGLHCQFNAIGPDTIRFACCSVLRRTRENVVLFRRNDARTHESQEDEAAHGRYAIAREGELDQLVEIAADVLQLARHEVAQVMVDLFKGSSAGSEQVDSISFQLSFVGDHLRIQLMLMQSAMSGSL